jgi:dTDP-4-dehydrorhamnose reductase
MTHDWPGNVRELERLMERAVTLATGDVIELDDLPLTLRGDYGSALGPSLRHLAIRVAWVFGPEKPSFVDSIIERALANDRVEAIADKTSCMTFTEDVASWLEPFLDGDLPGGLYHACNAGGCSWHEYGQHALTFAARAGLPLKACIAEPIPLSALKAFVAPRPPPPVMDTTKLTAVTGAVPRPGRRRSMNILKENSAEAACRTR